MRDSGAVWKIIVMPSVWNVTVGKSDAWCRFSSYWYDGKCNDTSSPEERGEYDDLIDQLKDGQGNPWPGVLFVSGDVHWAAIDDGSSGPGLAPRRWYPSVVNPPANMTDGGQQEGYQSKWVCPAGQPVGLCTWGVNEPPANHKGYTVLELRHNPDQVTVKVKDLTGTVKLQMTCTPTGGCPTQ